MEHLNNHTGLFTSFMRTLRYLTRFAREITGLSCVRHLTWLMNERIMLKQTANIHEVVKNARRLIQEEGPAGQVL